MKEITTTFMTEQDHTEKYLTTLYIQCTDQCRIYFKMGDITLHNVFAGRGSGSVQIQTEIETFRSAALH